MGHRTRAFAICPFPYRSRFSTQSALIFALVFATVALGLPSPIAAEDGTETPFSLAVPPYPRLMTMLWSDPEPRDFGPASRFDAVEFSWEDIIRTPGYADSVRAMKVRNPNLKAIATVGCNVHCSNWLDREAVMSEWTQQMAAHDSLWWLRDVDGDYWKTVGPETSCAEGWMNFTQTDMAEAFAEYLYQDVFVNAPGVFDGIHFDLLVERIAWVQTSAWTTGGVDSIDSNRDGIADHRDSLNAWWAEGSNAFSTRMRELCADQFILFVNGSASATAQPLLNGRFHEGFPGPVGGQQPDWYRSMFDPQIGYLNEPALFSGVPQHMITLQGLSWFPFDCDPLRLSTTDTPYNPGCMQGAVNLTVASALLSDGYACFTGWGKPSVPPTAPIYYHTTWWFPLYDTLRVNLGTPLGAAYDSATAYPGVTHHKRQFTGGFVRVAHTTGAANATGSFDLRPKAIFVQSPTATPWVVGETRSVSVRAADPMTGRSLFKLRLLLSRNGGATFPETLAVKSAVDSVIVFQVPGPENGSCRVRIEARDYGGQKGWSTSGPFAIRDQLWEGEPTPVGAPDDSAGVDAHGIVPGKTIAILPNPAAGGETRVSFRLAGDRSRVDLGIYDVSGRRVHALAGGVFPAGVSIVSWNGRDDRGRRVAPGLYVVRLTTEGDDARTERLTIVR